MYLLSAPIYVYAGWGAKHIACREQVRHFGAVFFVSDTRFASIYVCVFVCLCAREETSLAKRIVHRWVN